MTSLIRLGITLFRKPQTCIGIHNRLYIQPKLYDQIRHAGHAKWQNIRSTKSANDASKSKRISRYCQMVRQAVLSGGRQPDPKINKQLNDVLASAAKDSVPKATLERAIERAMKLNIYTIHLEIEGPGKCAIIAKAETESANILRRDVKKIIKKFDSNLMKDDTLINMFKSQGFIRVGTTTKDGREVDQDYAEEAAIVANALDVALESTEDENGTIKNLWVFSTDSENFNPCRGELEKLNLSVVTYDLDLVPYREIDFPDEVHEKTEELEKALREHDQVIEVYHNLAARKE